MKAISDDATTVDTDNPAAIAKATEAVSSKTTATGKVIKAKVQKEIAAHKQAQATTTTTSAKSGEVAKSNSTRKFAARFSG